MSNTSTYMIDDADTLTFEAELYSESDIPEAPEQWELDDFSDLLAY